MIGGPPCQAFSRLRHIVEHNGYQVASNLIPEFERCIDEARPAWFVMENVPDAPLPMVPGYGVQPRPINNRWLGGEQERRRMISFGWRSEGTLRPLRIGEAFDFGGSLVPLESAAWAPAVCASGGIRAVPVAIGGSDKPKRRGALASYGYKTIRDFREACRLQGLPDDFEIPGFTVKEALRAVGNGVPLPMGRAIARAVKRVLTAGDERTCT